MTSLIEILIQENCHAKHLFQRLYRSLRQNLINDLFLKRQESETRPDSSAVKDENTPNTRLRSICPSNSPSINTNYASRLTEIMDPSDFSQRSMSISQYSKSKFPNRMSPRSGWKRSRNNEWQFSTPNCPFAPSSNSFYQKYVLRYTRFKPRPRS